jgi:hypothetical protein
MSWVSFLRETAIAVGAVILGLTFFINPKTKQRWLLWLSLFFVALLVFIFVVRQ